MGLISLGCIGQKVQFCDLQPGLTQALGLGVTTGAPVPLPWTLASRKSYLFLPVSNRANRTYLTAAL